MQRFINDPDFVVDDTVRGFVSRSCGDAVRTARPGAVPVRLALHWL